MKRINHREAFGFWLNEFGLLGQGAEIGCAHAQFAELVLSQWKGAQYWMIDPWANQSPEVYRERQPEPEHFEQQWQKCLELSQHDSRVKLLRQLSAEAVSSFADAQLDWVYIDANHDYTHVLQDLELWYPKVKIDGIVGGHDYVNRIDNGWFCQVEDALNRWTRERNLSFSVTPCTSWWIYK